MMTLFFSARNNDTPRFPFSFDLFRDGQCNVVLSTGWVRDHNVQVYIHAYALATRRMIFPLPDEPHEPFSTRSTLFVYFFS